MRKVLIVNYKDYSDKIIKISELWVLWYVRQRPRGCASKSSILINKAYIKQSNNICEIIRNIEIADKKLTEIKVKSKTKVTAFFIRAHSKRRLRIKEARDLINKINKPALNRIFQAYPAYIRVIGLKISNIPAQIGSFRLILPILGSSGYLTIILSKIDFKALPVDFRLIKGQFKVKYSCLYRIFQAYPAYI